MRFNRHTVVTITPAATRPIIAADMRAFLNLETTADDTLLEAFIDAGVDAIRQYCKRSLVTETLELRMDGFPGYEERGEIALGPGMHTVSYPWLTSGGGSVVDLPFGPVASITSITTYGKDNSGTVFSSDNYQFDRNRVYLNESAVWPTDLRRQDAVYIRYTSGSAASDIPAAIIQSLKVHVAAMYECREGCEMPPACKAMLAAYRRMDQMGFEW